MVNAQLLKATMLHIAQYPELHNQMQYFEITEFGIAACFAGRALLLAGYNTTLPLNIGSTSCFAQHPDTKETVAVWEEARRLLGLTRSQASMLFSSVNTRMMLECTVQAILSLSSIGSERFSDLVPE